MACFTGNYPLPVPLEMDKLGLEPPGWGDRHDIDWQSETPGGNGVWSAAQAAQAAAHPTATP